VANLKDDLDTLTVSILLLALVSVATFFLFALDIIIVPVKRAAGSHIDRGIDAAPSTGNQRIRRLQGFAPLAEDALAELYTKPTSVSAV
jgi:hypothetical protein